MLESTNPLVFDPNCQACDRLADFLREKSREYPDYHCAPVAPFGAVDAKLWVVGLAPGLHGANASGRPFTGDHAGILLYQTLYHFGFCSRPESVDADDGLTLNDCRITNAVKCVPPNNKPIGAEISRCNHFLKAELAQATSGTVMVALGRIAHEAVLKAFDLKRADFAFAHGAEHDMPRDMTLIDSYHCSRYNTQTRRLTTEMFENVFRRATALMAE